MSDQIDHRERALHFAERSEDEGVLAVVHALVALARAVEGAGTARMGPRSDQGGEVALWDLPGAARAAEVGEWLSRRETKEDQ